MAQKQCFIVQYTNMDGESDAPVGVYTTRAKARAAAKTMAQRGAGELTRMDLTDDEKYLVMFTPAADSDNGCDTYDLVGPDGVYAPDVWTLTKVPFGG